MKSILINGSPRKNGNTASLLKKVQDQKGNVTAKEVGKTKIHIKCGTQELVVGFETKVKGPTSVKLDKDSLALYMKAVDEGRKPISNIIRNPPMRRDAIRFTRMTDLGWFDPAEIPETDFSPILDNWTAAGVWKPMVGASVPLARGRAGRASLPIYRLTRLGEYYQPKVNSLLTGFHMAAHMGGRVP